MPEYPAPLSSVAIDMGPLEALCAADVDPSFQCTRSTAPKVAMEMGDFSRDFHNVSNHTKGRLSAKTGNNINPNMSSSTYALDLSQQYVNTTTTTTMESSKFSLESIEKLGLKPERMQNSTGVLGSLLAPRNSKKDDDYAQHCSTSTMMTSFSGQNNNGQNNNSSSSACAPCPSPVDADCNVNKNYICLYLAALAGFSLIQQTFHDIGLSTLLTVGNLIQVIALSSLLIGVLGRRSVVGLSARSLMMQSLSYALRLCSTSWLKGYIPVDSTGDWLYQLSDFAAMCICLRLCWLAYYSDLAYSYDSEKDTFPAKPVVCFCCTLAILVHPDLNNRPIFDAVWTAALYIDVVSTLPQLWMIGRQKGQADALSAHYVALIVVSRCVAAVFWYYGHEELAPENAFNYAGYAVFGAHILHIFLLWDFIWCYLCAIYRGKILQRQIDLSVDI